MILVSEMLLHIIKKDTEGEKESSNSQVIDEAISKHYITKFISYSWIIENESEVYYNADENV